MPAILLGLFAWIAVGVIAGALARPLLPGRPPLPVLVASAVGVAGGLGGGLLATWLGFGGLAGFDVRAAVFATLCAMIAVLLLRTFTLDEPA